MTMGTHDEDKVLLSAIDDPEDLRRLPLERLPAVAQEMRDYLVESVSQSGGHLAAGLGAVELTLALHYALDTPRDRLVWDVGHQCYAHKVLTGRRSQLPRIRQAGGPAGFPVRDESPYDAFGVGHSSTSISAALGMALAERAGGEHRRCAAIIGDGGLSAGEALEALNHAGDVKADLLVVLNDNEMSISENVGALSNYLTRLLSEPLAGQLRRGARDMLRYLPPIHELARRTEGHVKGLLAPATLFEELGFHYFGPVDGHNVEGLVRVLRNLRDQPGPRLLHVVTRKGKGYAPAEEDPISYHGVSCFDPARGLTKGAASKLNYTDVFSRWVCRAACTDERVVAITPAMREGSGLVEYARRFPERYFDVGIAEQHAVTLAAGLACEGARPVVAIYSTFLQRAYDQVIHDVALQRLPVLFAVDRAGIVGADGATHQGTYDLSYLRCIPDLTVMAPADEAECWRMLATGLTLDGAAAVRYPRGTGPGVALPDDMEPVPVGRAEVRREGGSGVALLAFGALLPVAEAVGEELDVTVVNMRFVKPLDEALLRRLAGEHRHLVTLEENVIAGGAGSGVAECLSSAGVHTPVTHLGLPDAPVHHGARGDILAEHGLDRDGVRRTVQGLLQQS
ncbi:MAG: 1-deoxy-D-xylulose-5-phosphate synthase [Halorhodospira halophila]|uniref:1-deoxy-D-xylulose-5-phosphate synthase n=2 Tax=Ectothiorhodospiraceae TaxID=72276 RepID=UPI00191228BC|nr:MULTISPECIES: 1-deoxy-D-xylulose-5-phosphate synthase [Halorhodospira]MBK5943303.1 1-deoxy-D-xylulose-5-phosphate synthase [Halorhodospira halophila]MCC3751920.1 1-deoxy-D-xylulose-5-phosphate synthase [Halorhodospira halophila]MCG5526826.1 1-deoxy-D-xylulose-5-phosphate synthase [Halorhodospira halophila]MCG5533322.1 1-deoxy-D-xylulose-5-phosphate synthase [Halorhodospira sp. 9621]MCG5537841.1 1-deoxy-D-xylulose-5-phosphate synthase [Halorhodospira sp. 9622]